MLHEPVPSRPRRTQPAPTLSTVSSRTVVARRGRRVVGSLLAAVAGVALASCGDVESRTREVASDVRSQAEGRIDEAMQERLDDARDRFGGAVDVDRVCDLVADDRLTGPERDRLVVAVELGETLGLPSELVTGGRAVLSATDGETGQVGALRDACDGLGADLATEG